MSFKNMFTRLPAVEQYGKSSGQAFTRRKETNKRKRNNYRKRKIHIEQTGPFKRDFQVKRSRFMTQEFKDQNVLLVDGRLLCRHFIWERCIKGDDCQLEHVHGHNDLIKELCKFYVQGFCSKGERCPYMHKSFPCKFYHRKGRCSQGADCRFSHEPLNDVTNQLLDEALKQESDLYELTKKAKQESPAQPENSDKSGQPENSDKSEMTEAKRTPDLFLQPLRLNFYNRADTETEKKAVFCSTEEGVENAQEAVPPHTPETTQPHGPLSTNLNHVGPVCDSVETVLGLQQSKPFLTTQKAYECAPLSYSYCSSDSEKQSQVPYSVDAVLRSRMPVENSTFSHTTTPPTAQTVSYTPKTYMEEGIDPLRRLETQTKEVLCSANTRNEANKSQEKMFKSVSSLQVRTGPSSKTCPNPPLVSLDHKKQGRNMPESLKPAQKASHDVKLELLSSDITCPVNCKSEDVDHIVTTNRMSSVSSPRCQTHASKHPKQLKPHLSVLTSDSPPSFKPFCSSLEFKTGTAVPVEPASCPIKSNDYANFVSCQFAPNQPTEIHLHSKETQSGLKLGTKHSTETTAERSSKMAHCDDLVVGCKNTLKRPFNSLFASSITDTLQSIDISSPQHSIQSSCPVPQATSHPKTTDKTSVSSFLSLFAAPLPCMQPQPDYSRTSLQSIDNTSHLSDSKHRTSNSETPLPHQVRTKEISNAPRSPSPPPDNKTKKYSSTELIIHPSEQLVNPDRATACGDSPFTSHTREELPNISSHKGSAAAATANSALKTLFLCLSPYKQEGEQQDSIQCPFRK